MIFSNSSRISLTLLIALAVAAFSMSAKAQQTLDTKAIEDEINTLTQNRNVGELADELAQRSDGRATTGEMLKKLMVFSRAGHRGRVRETLRRLPEAVDFEIYKSSIFYPAQKAAGDEDLEARRIFYEMFAPAGDSNEESFVELWRKSGDVRGLEGWLAARRSSEAWWREWLRIKQSIGEGEEALAWLEREIRTKPDDWVLIERYFRSTVNDSNRSVAWLAEAVASDTAFDAYQLAIHLSHREPQIAAELFEKSLMLPFTEKDRESFGWYVARSFGMPPEIKNPEKQLRFWTKKALADGYRINNQPQLAQPLVEELTAMDTSGIIVQAEEVYQTAGQVQAASGERVVEAKILQDEAQKQDLPEYWAQRAQYYQGRKEKELVWQTLVQALEKFPYQSDDAEASKKRLRIMNLVRWYGVNFEKKQAEEVLRREFIQTAKNKNYAFALTRIVASDYEELLDEFFTNKNLLPQILAARAKWRQEEGYFIGDVMRSQKWRAKETESVWNQLSVLARRDIRNRAYSLAKAMMDRDEYHRAIPFLEELLKIAPEDFQGDLNYNREYVQMDLFAAYLASGDWRSAEKMYRGGFNYWNDALGRIALAAAKNGDVADAVRLWKLNANFDRQDLRHLGDLAQTQAKPFLRDFYLEMKKRDPLTDAPDKALRLLQ